MNVRQGLAVIMAAALLLISVAAHAGTGKIKIYLKNEVGAKVDGKVTLKQFTDQKTQDQRIRSVISKVKMYNHPDLLKSPPISKLSGPERFRTHITIRLASGEEYSRWTQSAKGFVEKPLTQQEMRERYSEFAGLLLTECSVEKTYEIVRDLEKVTDIKELMTLARGT